MKSKIITYSIQFLISLLPLIYLGLLWNELPDRVPMHYNINNEVDRMGSKKELIFAMGLMAAIGMGVALLLQNIHRFDPKRKYAENSAIMSKIAWSCVVFISAIASYIIYETRTFSLNEKSTFSGKGILVLVSSIFIVLGNFLNNVKPNYFVGFRTPWNLENEENWRLTHRLASKLMFFGGMVLIVLILALPEPFASYAFMLGLIPVVLIPFVYSYLLFKREKH
jgi:uncharacterized membrane protein